MRLLVVLGLLFDLLALVVATGPVPVQHSGLAGIDGFAFYNPYCGHACYRSFSPFTLSCSGAIEGGGHTTGDELAREIALCRASSFPFLSSIAWCIHLYCPGHVRASTIETFWETEITGDVSVLPQWSYGETMSNITKPPTRVLTGEALLNETVLTTDAVFNETENTLVYYFRETALESYYGVATCVAIFAVPILLTWMEYLPFMTRLRERVQPYLWSSIIGTYNERPLPYSLGNVPTIGQALFILLMVILNIIFISVGYKALFPNRIMQWYENYYQELMFYVCLRTGAIAFCLMPVMFLFSSRNNILLWLTDWSHSTYLLFHRWIARIFVIQALLHSILALVLWVKTDEYASNLPEHYWVWGCVATVAAVAILLTSSLLLRRRAYDLFLPTHIVLAVIFIVGCWYHIQFEYEFTFGYETWLYVTIAVWFFDRLIRVLRLLKAGLRHAKVSEVGSGIIRVDIPGLRWIAQPGHRVHVHFPTLNPLRPWENHPFSIVSTETLKRRQHILGQISDGDGEICKESNKALAVRSGGYDQMPRPSNGLDTNAGITIFIRKAQGMTSFLKDCENLLTLVDGPYRGSANREALLSDRLLLIGGGIGITGLLSFLNYHQNAKLYYSVKADDQCLVDVIAPVLDEVREQDIIVGGRLPIDTLLRKEADVGWRKVAVIVCGPPGMCDDVRVAVTKLAKEKTGVCSFSLEVDSFSW